MKNGRSESVYEHGKRHPTPAAVFWALSLFTFSLGGCNQMTHPAAEDARHEVAQERQCATENFRLEDYTVVNMANRDPAVRAALVHAGKIMEQSESEIHRKYCVFEKVSVKNPERCFDFFLKVPTPGGGGMICVLNGQDISRVYLEE